MNINNLQPKPETLVIWLSNLVQKKPTKHDDDSHQNLDEDVERDCSSFVMIPQDDGA